MRRSCVSCCPPPVPAPAPFLCRLVLCRYLCPSLDQFRVAVAMSVMLSTGLEQQQQHSCHSSCATCATGLNDAKYVCCSQTCPGHRPLSQLAHSSHSFGAQFDPFMWICHQQNRKTVHKFHLFFNKVIFVVSINPSLCSLCCCLCLCLSMSNNGRIRFRWPKKEGKQKVTKDEKYFK